MQTRFERYFSKFQARIISGEQIINQREHRFSFFGDSHKSQKIELTKMREFLDHLKAYEEKTKVLIENHPENKAYYESYNNHVLTLLEGIEKKFHAPTKLVMKDFILLVPSNPAYKKTGKDMINDIYAFAKVGGIAGGISGAVVGALGFLLFCATTLFKSVGIMALDNYTFAIILTVCAAIGAVPGFVLGAVFGGVIGFFVGVIAACLLEEPLTNDYLNGEALNTELLKDAYIEAIKKIGCQHIEMETFVAENNFSLSC